ncbi:MAG: hypothetical protein PHT00_02910 [Candidatus Methanomethylophilus sp.]|nr:hypothetical protein [Methanomethylophilus sp.]MDD3233103.1 hypothetical protein [Methanomethylophilus sp.]MDD4222210.1 hypothetical protein [Methanomethylophilus sp.]MDD4668486.1 hypothetical protein [Methanomethylophilus sp.]
MSNIIWKSSAKVGCGLSIIAGIIAMIGLAVYFRPEQGAVLSMAVILLSAALFFGLAGGFTQTAQWSPKVLMFMCFVTAGVIIGGTVAGYYDLWFGGIETVMAILIAACACLKPVRMFITHVQEEV